MHSDQTRKDGSSESMIQALYIMPLLPTMSRPGCTVYVMRYTVYPGLVSCPFYAMSIYPFKFIKKFIYLSPFIFFTAFSSESYRT